MKIPVYKNPVYKDRRGFVLIVVLWAVVIVTVIALGFGRRAVLDTRAAAYSVDQAEALMLARGAAERGLVEVQNKQALAQMALLLQQTQSIYTYLGQPWARPGDMYKDGVYYSKKDKNAKDTATYTIVDAERYININSADEELLKGVKAVKPGLLRKIRHRLRESKKDETPSAFIELEELRYMEGVDDDDWFGTGKKPGIVDLLTVGVAPSADAVPAENSARINVNTASEEVLKCVPHLQDETIRKILLYRNGDDGIGGTADDRGFASLEDLEAKTGLAGEGAQSIGTYCSFNSESFIITGTATRQGGKVRATCTVLVTAAGDVVNVDSWKEEALGA